MTTKEAIANLNHIYGIVSPDIQRSLDLAIKALEERPQGECEKCTYRIFTEKFSDCISEAMAQYGITSIEELQARLQEEMRGNDNE